MKPLSEAVKTAIMVDLDKGWRASPDILAFGGWLAKNWQVILSNAITAEYARMTTRPPLEVVQIPRK